MNISAKEVKELRDKTGCGMMDCKGALVEAGGDQEKAIDILRKKGMAKADKKSDRSANEGAVISYIHPGNRIGVLLEVNCETDFVATNETFLDFTRDIAMHIAAANPMAITREEVDMDLVNKEMEIYKDQALAEGKPEKVIDRIVEGKLNKYYQENCLLEQTYVKDPDLTVKDYLTNTVSKTGENINIARFVRYEVGAK